MTYWSNKVSNFSFFKIMEDFLIYKVRSIVLAYYNWITKYES